MGYAKEVLEYIINTLYPDDLQKLLTDDNFWKMFTEEAGLSSDEAKELYDNLKKLIGNRTMEDQKKLPREILARRKFVEVFPKVKAEFESCIQKLRALAEEVDRKHKVCTISNLVSSAVGAASGVMSIVALALAPSTAGTDLLLVSAGGAGLGMLSGSTSVTTTIVEESGTYSAEAEAQRILKISEDNMNRLLKPVGKTLAEIIEEGWNFKVNMKDLVSSIRAIREIRANPGLAHEGTPLLWEHLTQRAQVASREFPDTVLSMTREAQMSALFLGLDMYSIVKDSQHLYEGAKAPLAEVLREKAKELEQVLENLNKIFPSSTRW